MTHDATDLPDDEPGSERNDHLPATEAGARTAPVPRQPMEQVARAMAMQSELMKQMHERQRLLEEVVKDNRRHELVINSAQALNESFQGLQRVQERLADKLEDTGGVSRSRFLVITLALLALAATGGIVAWRIVEKADDFNASLRVALDPKARDRDFQDVMSKLEGRIQHVEEADRAAFREEIEQLRKTRDAITTERDTLRRERDGAREELGAAKAALAGSQSESAEAKNKLQGLEKDNARLTAEALGSQKTIVQLNDLVATMKGVKAAGSPQTASEEETARKPTTPRDHLVPPPEKPVEKHVEKPAAEEDRTAAPPPAAPGRGEVEAATAVAESLVAFPEAQLAPMNDLFKLHNGSDRYEIKKAEKTGKGKLWNVVMEVRGPDGTLQKTIEAESFTILAGDKFVDLEFEGGSVSFHQGASKTVKSPFYNNKYKIVVLGANVKAWLASGLPFVRQK